MFVRMCLCVRAWEDTEIFFAMIADACESNELDINELAEGAMKARGFRMP